MALISDAYMKNLLKTVYLSGVTNAKYQNSPVLSAIGKETWTGGDEIRYAAQYGNGGNFGSNYAAIANDPTTGAQNLEWKMTQGYMCGMFDVNQPELLTSEAERGAYMKILNNKMAACFDGMSKTLALYLYGGKYGVIDKVQTDIASTQSSGNKMKVTSAGAIKMDIGTRFVIASSGNGSGSKPDSDLIGSPAVYTVTGIDDEEITFKASATGDHIYPGDYIELYTARVGSDARGIEGLADIIPAYEDRTGGDWTSYIKKNFRGVDRSVATSRLAGQFVKAASGATSKSDALVSLLKKTKRAGGLNNMIIVNDEAWDAIGAELGIQKNLWQASDGAASRQGATAGINELATAFGDAFVGRTVIDPFCTENLAYSIEKDDLKFYDLGNVSRVINPVANDQMGKHDVESVGDQGFGNDFGSHLNMDKLFTVEQGKAGEYGPSMRIAAHVYGNFKLSKTASMGVANLDDN